MLCIRYIYILTARDSNMGNCHPEKTNVDRGECCPLVQSKIIILY